MKITKYKNPTLTAIAAALTLGSSSVCFGQMLITNVVNTFDTAPSSGNGIGREWGPGAAVWDSTNGNPAGAELITVTWDPTSDTPCTAFACQPAANPWYNPTPITVSLYTTLEFDIKYDNTSDITISEFNDASTWPLSLTNNASTNGSVFQSWATQGQIAAGGQVGGLEVNLCGGPAGQMGPVIINTNMPDAASNGWTHVVIPINKAQANIDGISGIVFHKWCANTWTLLTPVSARFWIDNVVFRGTAVPPPPPTLALPAKPVLGLNVFASTEGNSFYDRQEAMLRQSTGLSWVGHATQANPVTYSFTIKNYPHSPDCEAYLFMAPNPGGIESAPDWNETNCAKVFVQGTPTNATLHFQYKVGEANQQLMYSGAAPYTNAPGSWDGVTTNWLESGDLGSVTNNTILGTWSLTFTSDTNVTLTAPNGNTATAVIPPYNVGIFAESTAFNVYLGMQANNANAMNQAVVYANFAISNAPGPFYENFLSDTALDTVGTWNTSMSGGPAGVLVVTPTFADLMTWTLPASGFGLQTSSTLTDHLSWTDLTGGPIIPMAGIIAQYVSTSELPGSQSTYFRLVKRQLSQLQVLLPGETNAPNTLSGKSGTPDPTISVSTNNLVTVTVNAVDSTFHIIPGVNDNVSVTTSAGTGAIDPNPAALVSGTGAFAIQFSAVGSWTVTATDNSNTNIPPATSSSLNVNN